MNLAYPYGFDRRGRTADTTDERHVRDLIEQVLFTAPGERVMRPDFGSGVAQLVFAPNSVELAATTQMLVQSSLQQWLDEIIEVQAVSVEASDAVLSVTVRYSLRQSDEVEVQVFRRDLGGGA